MKKKVLSILLVLSLLLCATGVGAAESGKCGVNAVWEQNDAGILTISGTGRMEDYQDYGSNSPFRNLPTTSQIVIGEGITYIGKSAFHGLKFVSLSLSNTIMSIGNNAFLNSGVSEINFNNGLISIGELTFRYCRSLVALELPDTVQTLGDLAFEYCSGMVKASLGAGIKNIGKQAFYECVSLEKVEIGKNIKTIGSYAFGNCKKLTDVYYAGSESDWKNIIIGDGNEPLTDAKIHYNSTISSAPQVSVPTVTPTPEVTPAPAPANPDAIKVLVDGVQVSFDQEPIMINDRVMVPIRAVAEAIGDDVRWEGEWNTAIIVHPDRIVGFKTGNNTARIAKGTGLADYSEYYCDVPPQNINGRVLTPLRAIGETLGADVQWDGNTKTVYITTGQRPAQVMTESLVGEILGIFEKWFK